MSDTIPFPFAGEFFALSAALVWALAFVLFKWCGEQVPPIALNLFKNLLAAVLLTATLLVIGTGHWPKASTGEYALLALSGILGIALADTLLFAGLNRLGAGLTAVVDCSYAPAMVACAAVFLGERVSVADAAGGLLIISGILVGTIGKQDGRPKTGSILGGVCYALSAVVLMAVGIVMVKPLLNRSPLLWVAYIRLLAGTLVLAVMAAAVPRMRKYWRHFIPGRGWRVTVPASILGTYFAMLFWVAGMKYTYVSTSAILNQTSVIFIIILAAAILREPLGVRKFAAVLLGVAGALIVNLN